MKKIILCLIFVSSAHATCMIERLQCSPTAPFQNIYEIAKVSCSAPGGPVRITRTFNMYNPINSLCGANPKPGCLKPIVSRVFNYTRHDYFQAEIRIDRSGKLFAK